MTNDRKKDRHLADGRPILVRPTKEQRTELEAAVKVLAEKASPGARLALSAFVLDVALAAARDIMRSKK